MSTDRPNRRASQSGAEKTVIQGDFRLTLRQVGWHGQSGDFYSLDENPAPTEPGSFSPLWIIAHADRIEVPVLGGDA